jgi:hypothetical protein
MKHTKHKNGIIDEKKWKGGHGGSPLNVIRQYLILIRVSHPKVGVVL